MELDAKEGHEDVTIVESPPSEVPDPSTEDSASKTEVPTTPGSTPSSHTPTSSSTSKVSTFETERVKPFDVHWYSNTLKMDSYFR